MKSFILSTFALALLASSAFAHCQVPCGIYDDAARFAQMREHVATIDKAMVQLEAAHAPINQQFVRWVNNKEHHADELTEIVTAYFLAQRIKGTEPTEKYTKELTLLHKMIVTSMKAKQTTNRDHVATLRTLIDQFEAIYLK